MIETGTAGETQLTVRCEKMTPALRQALDALAGAESPAPGRIVCRANGVTRLLDPRDIFYLESVENTVFAYTRTEVLPTTLTLAAAGEELAPLGFLRVSKTVVVNVNRLQSLESRLGGGIDGLLENREHILVSRRYAKALRDYLKGGNEP